MITTNALTLNGSGLSDGGALINSSGTAANYLGSVTLASASSIGSTTGALTLTGVVNDAGNFGLVFVGSHAITLVNASNALSTIASGNALGALSVINAGALTIDSVTIGSTTYSGLDSTDRISVETLTGDLTISQNVNTASASTSPASPALLLAAGASEGVGNTSGNIVLIGTPNFSVGTNGIADFYSGAVAESTGLSSYVATKPLNSTVFAYTRSYQPSSLGYNVIYRSQAPSRPESIVSVSDTLPSAETGTVTVTNPSVVSVPLLIAIATQGATTPTNEECTLINTLESLQYSTQVPTVRAKPDFRCRVVMSNQR
jgi:hypothetical protein